MTFANEGNGDRAFRLLGGVALAGLGWSGFLPAPLGWEPWASARSCWRPALPDGVLRIRCSACPRSEPRRDTAPTAMLVSACEGAHPEPAARIRQLQ